MYVCMYIYIYMSLHVCIYMTIWYVCCTRKQNTDYLLAVWNSFGTSSFIGKSTISGPSFHDAASHHHCPINQWGSNHQQIVYPSISTSIVSLTTSDSRRLLQTSPTWEELGWVLELATVQWIASRENLGRIIHNIAPENGSNLETTQKNHKLDCGLRLGTPT